jgi:hypothetical protein
MAKRIAPIRVISFLLLAACGVWCQSEPAGLVHGLQFDGSNSPEVQRPETRTWRSLPDAPSAVQPPTQAEKFQTFVDQACSPLTLGAVGMNAGVMRETKLGYVTPGLQPSFTASYKAALTQKQSSTFFAPTKWMTFASTFGQVHHETTHGADDLEYYGHHILWAGSVILRISQQAKAHPHITRALMMVQPQF